MTAVYLNQIATATPDHDVHQAFVQYAPTLLVDERQRTFFERMIKRSQIEHRYSCLSAESAFGPNGFYQRDAFPGTGTRMQIYRENAFPLAKCAIDKLNTPLQDITHIIVTSCTGFYAPGIDLEIAMHYGLAGSVERTMIGFMGCYAAINALKLARHIVRSKPSSQILIINIELCTLHMQDNDNLEELLSFTLFADGCAASIVSAEPKGIELSEFWCTTIPASTDHITWQIGDLGFDMALSGQVPQSIVNSLPDAAATMLHGKNTSDIAFWAVHPGGRTVLDAVERGLSLPPEALAASRDILRRFGNMSSATIMFVLKTILDSDIAGIGCAMAFGPGVTMETILLRKIH